MVKKKSKTSKVSTKAKAKGTKPKAKQRACKICGRKGFNSRTCGGGPSSHDAE